MYVFGKTIVNQAFSKYVSRYFAQAILVEPNFARPGSQDFSFVMNTFRGKIEPRQVFPYPDVLTKEQRNTLKNLATPIEKFIAEEIKPFQQDAVGKVSDDALKRLWELGAFKVSKDLGDLCLRNTQYARLVDLVGAHELGVGISLATHQSMGLKGILLYGSEEQKEKFLPKVTKGEVAAFCLTEPKGVSDVCSLSTHAELDAEGKNYILNGSKVWACENGLSQVMMVFANTSKNPIKPGDNVTAFIVEKSFEGISNNSTLESDDKLTEVIYKDVKIPVENVLGGVGNGYKIATNLLNNGRFGMAASLAGTMRVCTNKAVEFANTRSEIGDRINNFGCIQEKIARMVMLQYATEAMAYMISSNMDNGSQHCNVEAAISKCFASEAAWYVCDEAMQIMGGMTFLKEAGLECVLKDLRTFRAFEGTNDMLRLYIALTGLQYAVPQVEEYQKALKTPTDKFGFICKQLARKGLSLLGKNAFLTVSNRCHGRLHSSTMLLGKSVDSFGLAVHSVIARYGKSLEKQHFILNRVADCTMDIYSSACVLSRVNNAIKNALPTADHEQMIAEAWIREAYKRVVRNVQMITSSSHVNHYESLCHISKEVCQNKKILTKNPLNL